MTPIQNILIIIIVYILYLLNRYNDNNGFNIGGQEKECKIDPYYFPASKKCKCPPGRERIFYGKKNEKAACAKICPITCPTDPSLVISSFKEDNPPSIGGVSDTCSCPKGYGKKTINFDKSLFICKKLPPSKCEITCSGDQFGNCCNSSKECWCGNLGGIRNCSCVKKGD